MSEGDTSQHVHNEQIILLTKAFQELQENVTANLSLLAKSIIEMQQLLSPESSIVAELDKRITKLEEMSVQKVD